jgi:monoamine oxidase
VLVLGAGIAGLCTAYELEKAGYRCEVLEARDRPGGRCWTVRGGTREIDLDGASQTAQFADGQYMNAGPARIPQHHTTLDYCRELGVAIEPFANANADAYYYNESAQGFDGPLVDRRLRRRVARADYLGYVSELLTKAIDQRALDASVGAADREALLEFLTSFGALNQRGRYVGSERRGYVTAPGAANLSGVVGKPYTLSGSARRQLRGLLPVRAGLGPGDDDVPAGRGDGPHPVCARCRTTGQHPLWRASSADHRRR